MIASVRWLEGRHAVVTGHGCATEAVASGLETHGARVTRLASAIDAGDIAANFTLAERAGPIDLLVHGGVHIPIVHPESLAMDGWRASLSDDLDGRFLHAAEFGRRRLEAHDHGAILFLLPGTEVTSGRAAISAAVGAVDNLVKSLAVEWGRAGIRVNAIASRIIGGHDEAGDAERSSLSSLAAYLLSDYAAYITGTVSGLNEH